MLKFNSILKALNKREFFYSKYRNILLSGDNVVKLADLGGAKLMRQSISVSLSKYGTFPYMSPEMIEDENYSFPTDIWYCYSLFTVLISL